MIRRFPKAPPTFAQLMDDPLLAGLPEEAVCRVFDVSPRSVRRWRTTGAPRSVRLALWAVSLEGASTWEAEAHNRADMAQGLTRCLSEEVERLRGLLVLLLGLGDFGAANDPLGRLGVAPLVLPHAPSREHSSDTQPDDDAQPWWVRHLA